MQEQATLEALQMLAEEMQSLTEAIKESNQLITVMLQQNAALIESHLDEDVEQGVYLDGSH